MAHVVAKKQRLLFGSHDAKVVGEKLAEQHGEAPKWDRWSEFTEGMRAPSEFKCIGAAKVQLGHVCGPLTTWSEEELILRRYCKNPDDFCTLDVVGFYPCSSAWTIATRQSLKPGRAGGEIRALTFRNCQPLFVSGTDLSGVEVQVDGKSTPISNLVGHNETIPCNMLCQPLCELLGAGRWKALSCNKASLLVHTWLVLKETFDDGYFKDNEPAAPFA